MAIAKTLVPILSVAKNTRRLFQLALKMDRRLTYLYYFTSTIGAFVPLGITYVTKLIIDHLQLAQRDVVAVIPFVIIVLLGARYLISLFDNVVYSGINNSYLDYVFRYKLQNEIAYKFHEK